MVTLKRLASDLSSVIRPSCHPERERGICGVRAVIGFLSRAAHTPQIPRFARDDANNNDR
jgi:hypothetical protein